MSESVGYIYIGIFACRLPEELAKMHSNRDLNENVVKALPFFFFSFSSSYSSHIFRQIAGR